MMLPGSTLTNHRNITIDLNMDPDCRWILAVTVAPKGHVRHRAARCTALCYCLHMTILEEDCRCPTHQTQTTSAKTKPKIG